MTNKLVPIFSYAKIDGCHSDIQIPSPHHYNGDLLLSEKEQEQLLPWGQRADMLYFRGTTSGRFWLPLWPLAYLIFWVAF